MTARRKPGITITVDAASLPHSTVLAAPVRVLSPRLRELGIPAMYDAMRHGFRVPKTHPRLDDLLVRLELDGHRIDLVTAGW